MPQQQGLGPERPPAVRVHVTGPMPRACPTQRCADENATSARRHRDRLRNARGRASHRSLRAQRRLTSSARSQYAFALYLVWASAKTTSPFGGILSRSGPGQDDRTWADVVSDFGWRRGPDGPLGRRVNRRYHRRAGSIEAEPHHGYPRCPVGG
jgi:hypothetical protein